MINIRDNSYLVQFGKNLRKVRKEKGLSQEQLNLEAELGKNQIGLIERGEINITICTLKAISVALKIHPKELLNF